MNPARIIGIPAAGSAPRRPALVVLLALLLSLLTGGRAPSAERRADDRPATPAIAAPVQTPHGGAANGRPLWRTRGHHRTARPRPADTRPARKPWMTRGHPRKPAPTTREGSAGGPRAP